MGVIKNYWRKTMKVKSFDKKLSLNKKTIAHLEVEDLDRVKGGGITFYSCQYTQCQETRCLICP
jgi:natural product precursor